MNSMTAVACSRPLNASLSSNNHLLSINTRWIVLFFVYEADVYSIVVECECVISAGWLAPRL